LFLEEKPGAGLKKHTRRRANAVECGLHKGATWFCHCSALDHLQLEQLMTLSILKGRWQKTLIKVHGGQHTEGLKMG